MFMIGELPLIVILIWYANIFFKYIFPNRKFQKNIYNIITTIHFNFIQICIL